MKIIETIAHFISFFFFVRHFEHVDLYERRPGFLSLPPSVHVYVVDSAHKLADLAVRLAAAEEEAATRSQPQDGEGAGDGGGPLVVALDAEWNSYLSWTKYIFWFIKRFKKTK
jgi:hypothetical protein